MGTKMTPNSKPSRTFSGPWPMKSLELSSPVRLGNYYGHLVWSVAYLSRVSVTVAQYLLVSYR
jgi:hypothetical protein